MALQSGTYIITSKVQNAPVGRDLSEDKSLNPKKILVLPEGVEAPQIRGGSATEIDRRLFAVLTEETEPALWNIQPQFHQGKNTYTIIAAFRPDGWVAPFDREFDTQISVRPLIVVPTEPPQFPQHELYCTNASASIQSVAPLWWSIFKS